MSETGGQLTTEDEEAIELLTSVERYHEKLSAWEVGFLENISEQETLTIKQRATFEAICERVLK